MRMGTWRILSIGLAVASLWTLPSGTYAADAGNRITILYDAFGRPSNMQKDWGFSAFVEYGGKRILFDTGNNAKIFAHNVGVAGVDLKKLDFAVISHRHLDHTAGLTYLQTVNPGVRIYVPKELAGMFGSSLPNGFYRKDESLPAHMRYYDNDPPKSIDLGTPWAGAAFESVDKTLEISPGVHLISTVSEVPGTLEMRELSLAIETPLGLLVIAGCSHPGIEKIVEAARMIGQRIYLILGGFHLPSAPDTEVARIAATFHDILKVDHLAPSHCTGEPAFAIFQKTWGKRYVYAGLGTVIDLP